MPHLSEGYNHTCGRCGLKTPMQQKGVRSSLPMSAEASCGRSHAGADPEERVTTGQLLLQSYYEDQDRAMRWGGLHHSSLPGGLASLA